MSEDVLRKGKKRTIAVLLQTENDKKTIKNAKMHIREYFDDKKSANENSNIENNLIETSLNDEKSSEKSLSVNENTCDNSSVDSPPSNNANKDYSKFDKLSNKSIRYLIEEYFDTNSSNQNLNNDSNLLSEKNLNDDLSANGNNNNDNKIINNNIDIGIADQEVNIPLNVQKVNDYSNEKIIKKITTDSNKNRKTIKGYINKLYLNDQNKERLENYDDLPLKSSCQLNKKQNKKLVKDYINDIKNTESNNLTELPAKLPIITLKNPETTTPTPTTTVSTTIKSTTTTTILSKNSTPSPNTKILSRLKIFKLTENSNDETIKKPRRLVKDYVILDTNNTNIYKNKTISNISANILRNSDTINLTDKLTFKNKIKNLI